MSRRAEPAEPRGASERLRRRLTGLGSTGGLLFLLGVTPAIVAFPDVAWWWLAGAGLMLLALLILAVGHLVLPFALLATLWRVVPALCWMLEITQFAAWSPSDAAALQSWLWALQPSAVLLLALLLPAWKGIGWTVGLALAPVASALVFTGGVPLEVVHNTPLALTGVTLVLIFTSVRTRLIAALSAEAAARESERRSALLSAEAEQQRALARVVHDNVLAVFTAALQLGGRIPDELRAEARTALDVLGHELREASSDDGSMPADAAVGELLRHVRDMAPHAVTDTRSDVGQVPREAVAALAGAVGEAVRNSIRHGGADVALYVRIHAQHGALDVVVRDDGPGFDLDRIAPERLGVRESILGRVRAIDGGSAEVRTAPGRGTEVRLRWRR